MSNDIQVEARASVQCRAEREDYRLGRNVAQRTQCRNRTTHPSGFCHRHRSDDA